MLPSRIMRESVTVERPTTVESRGTSYKSFDGAELHEVSGVSLQETEGSFDLQGRDNAVAQANLYAPIGADIMRGDRVSGHGRLWEVVGEPREMGPVSGLAHKVASLREWVG